MSKAFTKNITDWISDTHTRYIREVRIQPSDEALSDDLVSYSLYKENLIDQLEKLRTFYASRSFAFAMIGLVHKLLPSEEVKDGMCSIMGRNVHVSNIKSPETLVQDEFPLYTDLLGELAFTSKKTALSQVDLSQFYLDLFNCDIKNIKREDIVKACYFLNYGSNQADYLFLRLGLDPLSARREDDCIYKFVLDVPGSLWDDVEKLREMLFREAFDNFLDEDEYSLSDIIQSTKYTDHDQRLVAYGRALRRHKHELSALDEYSKIVLTQILLYVAKEQGWQAAVFEQLPDKILDCEIIDPGSYDAERLLKAVCCRVPNSQDDLFTSKDFQFRADFSPEHIVFPAVVNDGLAMKSFYNRIFLLLSDKEEKVCKNDILLSLFLFTVAVQRNSYSNPLDVFAEFFANADAVLAVLELGTTYLPHPLEYLISKSILTGEMLEEAFYDVVKKFKKQENAKTEEKESAQKSKNQTNTLKNEYAIKYLPKEYHTLLANIKSNLEIASIDMIHADFSNELDEIADEIYGIWANIRFANMNVYFENDSIWCEPFYGSATKFEPVFLKHKPSQTLTEFLHGCDISLLGSLSIQLGQEKHSLSDLAKTLSTETTTDQANNSPGSTSIADLEKLWIPIKNLNPTRLADLEIVNKKVKIQDYLQLQSGATLLDLLNADPSINRDFRRKTVIQFVAGLTLGKSGVDEETLKSIRKAKKAKAGGDDCFYMPKIQAKDKLILKLSNMDLPGIEALILGKYIDQKANEGSWLSAEKDVMFDPDPVPNNPEFFTTDAKKNNGKKSSANATPRKADEEQYEDLNIDSMCLEDSKNLDLVSIYETEIKAYPKLKAYEEIELAKRAEQGDQSAKDQLVLSNLLLAFNIAKEYTGMGVSFMDLVQEGSRALVERAVERYDWRMGNRFSTYASHWIRNYIRKALSESLLVKIPKSVQDLLDKKKRKETEFAAKNGHFPNDRELAEAMEISISRLEYIKTLSFKPLSYNQPLSEDGGELFDLVRDETVNIEQDLINKLEQKPPLRQLLLNELQQCSPRAADVVSLHYGFFGSPLSFHEIADRLGISVAEVIMAENDVFLRVRANSSSFASLQDSQQRSAD